MITLGHFLITAEHQARHLRLHKINFFIGEIRKIFAIGNPGTPVAYTPSSVQG